MKTLIGIITALSIPIVLLNLIGGIVSGIWLAILGNWGSIILGIILFFISTLLISFALLPSILLDAPVIYFASKGKFIGAFLFNILSNLYAVIVITIWCCSILFIFSYVVTINNLIPRLIWSYGVAIGPLSYMASKERDNIASYIATFFASLSYITIIILVIFTTISGINIFLIFSSFMLLSLVIQTTFGFLSYKEQIRNGIPS